MIYETGNGNEKQNWEMGNENGKWKTKIENDQKWRIINGYGFGLVWA